MIDRWLGTTWEEVALVVISTVAIYLAVLTYTRIAGLRSFAKMSAFDFAMTVAVGSLIAGVATTSSATLANGAIALAVLFVLQVAVALARRSHRAARVIDNEPRLLVAHGRVLEDQLAVARMTHADLRAKLRGAGVGRVGDAAAVVLETTGEISVVEAGRELDAAVFEGVRGADRLGGGRSAP